MTVISVADITNRGMDETGNEAYKRYHELDRDVMSTREVLESDGRNLVVNNIITKNGTHCDRNELLRELAEQERVMELIRVWDAQVRSKWIDMAASRSSRRAAARLRAAGSR